jgi:hypothetical protein
LEDAVCQPFLGDYFFVEGLGFEGDVVDLPALKDGFFVVFIEFNWRNTDELIIKGFKSLI